MVIERPNQVWATDITYLPMAKGFVYLVAILDLYSRKVLAWRTSNTLTSDFCVEALQEALTRFGQPRDLQHRPGQPVHRRGVHRRAQGPRVAISMDGKGRWVDNVFVERLWRSVKYEEIYLHAYETPKRSQCGADPLLQFLQRPTTAPSRLTRARRMRCTSQTTQLKQAA